MNSLIQQRGWIHAIKRCIPPVQKLKQVVVLLAVCIFCISCSRTPSTITNPWKVLTLPSEAIFSDIAFTSNSDRGW